jgi:hypothetical protein
MLFIFPVLYGEANQAALVEFLRTIGVGIETGVEWCPVTLPLAIPYESPSTAGGADQQIAIYRPVSSWLCAC